MLFLSTLLISMFVTMALIPILRAAAIRVNCGLDEPNPRKVHCAPIPKVGGVAMAVGTLVPVLLVTDGGRFVNSVLVGAVVIAVFGMLDDYRTLGWKAKFAGQIAAALVVIAYGGVRICSLGEFTPAGFLLPDAACLPLTLLVIVGVTNAINLSDGLDGLAGGTSMLIFICIGVLALTTPELPERFFVMILCAAVAGAIFGFLRFNTHPAIVFMGDTGSQLLGFLAVCLSLGTTQHRGVLSPLLPLLLLGFPVLDTLTVMAERILQGRSPFSPDKNHFHHKLMRLGLFHSEAVMAIYAINAALVLAAFLLRFHSDWTLLAVYVLFSGAVVTGFTVAEHKGFRLQRQGFMDLAVKNRLRVIKEKSLVIRAVFPPLEFGLPLLFIAAGAVPAEIPGYLALAAAALAGLLAAVWFLRRDWAPALLRAVFYLLVPIVLRLGQVEPAAWAARPVPAALAAAFGALAFFMVMTLKFTRRQQGFKATPMDFLIVLIALVVPQLPDPAIRSVQMGDLAVRIIVMFFGFEVLMGELRGRIGRLTVGVLAGLALLAARGV